MENFYQVYKNNGQQHQDFMIIGKCYLGYINFEIHRFIDDENLYFGENYTEELPSDLSLFFSGSIKKDGCSNWSISNENGAMLHFCNKQDMMCISNILCACFDIAQEELGIKN